MKKRKERIKKTAENKGITLVALVITIIIIIILATVTINLSFGDNGLIKQAELASDLTANSTAYETQAISNLVAYMNEEFGNLGETEEPETPPDPEYPTIEEVLHEGDHVYYQDGTGATRECVVLYGPENSNYSSYGIQIITMETVEDVTLGPDDPTVTGSTYFDRGRESYNNAISRLNNATSKYLNTTYASRVRCVGSVPNIPSYDEAGMFTSSYSYMSSYNGLLKNTDNNYLTDWNQMNSVNTHNISKAYWLTSRNVNSDSTRTYFYVRYVNSSGNLGNHNVCNVDSRRPFWRWRGITWPSSSIYFKART